MHRRSHQWRHSSRAGDCCCRSLLSGCTDGPTSPSETAVVTFGVGGETFRVQLVGERQIEAARAAQGGGSARIQMGESSLAPASTRVGAGISRISSSPSSRSSCATAGLLTSSDRGRNSEEGDSVRGARGCWRSATKEVLIEARRSVGQGGKAPPGLGTDADHRGRVRLLGGVHVVCKRIGESQRGSGPRRFRRWLGLAGRVQGAQEETATPSRSSRTRPISLADDVAVTRRALAAQKGPVILVGHSYGGVVITEAGNDPKVAGLVYIAAFAPDKGESVSSLIQNPPPGAPVPPILPPQDGYLFLDKAKFAASFAADLSAEAAAFMADSQVPWGVDALSAADHRAGVEVQAELVPGRHGGQDDSSRRAALDVEARRLDGRRGQGQPRRLRVAARGGGVPHREGCPGGGRRGVAVSGKRRQTEDPA